MVVKIGPFACLGLVLSTCIAIFLALSVLPAGLGGLALWPFIFFFWAAVNRLIVFMSEGSEVDFEVWKQSRRDAGIPVPKDLPGDTRVLPSSAREEGAGAASRILHTGGAGRTDYSAPPSRRAGTGSSEFDHDARDFADYLRSGPF